MAADNGYTVVQDLEVPNDWTMTITTIDAANNYLYLKDGMGRELLIKIKSIYPASASDYATKVALKSSSNINLLSYFTHSDGTETFKIVQSDPTYRINTALVSVQEREYSDGIGGAG